MFKFPDRMRFGPLMPPEMAGEGSDNKRLHQPRLRFFLTLVSAGTLLAVTGDVLLDLMADILDMAFDFIEETLEGFYRKTAKMDLRQAQMATAYTYFAFAVILTATLGRRLWRWVMSVVGEFAAVCHAQAEHAHRSWEASTTYLKNWWETLDWLNKLAVVFGVLLGAVPLFLLLSFGLGAAVAELF